MNIQFENKCKHVKTIDDSGSIIAANLLDQGVNPELIKHNKGIVKSRKGGKSKNNNSSLFYQEALKKSSSGKHSDSSPDSNRLFTKDDEIKELDEEDEEEHKSIANISPI